MKGKSKKITTKREVVRNKKSKEQSHQRAQKPSQKPGPNLLDTVSHLFNLNKNSNIVAAIVIPILYIVIFYVLTDIQIKKNIEIQNKNQKIEVTKIFFDNYYGKNSDQQIATIDILNLIFPEKFDQIYELLKKQAKNPEVKNKINKKVIIRIDKKSKRYKQALEIDKKAYLAFLNRDLRDARIKFKGVENLLNGFHYAYEMSVKVLSVKRVKEFYASNSEKKNKIYQKLMLDVLKNYDLKLHPKIKNKLKQIFRKFTPFIYIHIMNESQRKRALKVKKMLKSHGFFVENLENVSYKKTIFVPSQTEIRYFNKYDRDIAIQIKKIIKDKIKLKSIEIKYLYWYNKIPRLQIEIWFSNNF